jgi:hypothetical protein
MTVRLRPHHLLCILTYKGAGYSQAFCANYDRIAARIGEQEEIEICAGPDDVCAPLLLTEHPHCFNLGVTERDDKAGAAVAAMLGFPVAAGTRFALDKEMLDRSRRAFADGVTREACIGCQWQDFCTEIADHGFAETRLLQAKSTI